MNIIFHNWCGNGDLHIGRQFVKDIINKMPDNKYYYCHRQSKRTFKDISNLDQNYSYDKLREKIGPYCYETSTRKVDDNLFINTWIGQNNMEFVYTKQCSIYAYYDMFKRIYDELSIKIENVEYYLPTIDYNYFYLDNINFYLDHNTNRKILVCNGNCISGQSNNFEFNSIIDILSDDYKDFHFLLTDDGNRIKKDNIFYTKDIINNREDSDLAEISYLSTFCDNIIGRASGPYISTLVRENFYNGKKFIAFSNNRLDAAIFETSIGSIFIVFTDYKDVYNKIKNNI